MPHTRVRDFLPCPKRMTARLKTACLGLAAFIACGCLCLSMHAQAEPQPAPHEPKNDTATSPQSANTADAMKPSPLRNDVVVLANGQVPEGLEVAKYYCRRRAITPENLLVVKTASEEEIAWETFRNEILKPVTDFLASRPEVLYLVPVFGIPLKIREENTKNDEEASKANDTVTKIVLTRDYCSVDAELTLVRRPDHPVDGWLPSEVFRRSSLITPEDKLLLISRLDGPSAAIAKRLVDDAIYGEFYGIVGKAYIDIRGLEAGNPYYSGDQDMREAWESIKNAGYQGALDEKPELIDFPTLDSPALYWGWYAGDCKPSKDFKFVRGAVGAHLHSFAAHTIRAKDKAWVGPLLHYGIAATMGTVYEPLQSGFPMASFFFDRFLAGNNFAQSGYMANMFLSWQAVFAGDPLYCPYAEGWKERQAANRVALQAAVDGLSAAVKAGKPKETIESCKKVLAFGIEDENAEAARRALSDLDSQAATKLANAKKLAGTKKAATAIPILRQVSADYATLPSGDEAAKMLAAAIAGEDAAAGKVWAKAEELEAKKELARALEKYKEIASTFPESTLAERARAKVTELTDDPEKAKVVAAQQREQAASSLMDKANTGLKNKRTDLAKKYLKEILDKFPETQVAVRAKEKLNELK